MSVFCCDADFLDVQLQMMKLISFVSRWIDRLMVQEVKVNSV